MKAWRATHRRIGFRLAEGGRGATPSRAVPEDLCEVVMTSTADPFMTPDSGIICQSEPRPGANDGRT
jgi:hypothetical protein